MCTLDGQDVPCEMVNAAMQSGGAVQCPNNLCDKAVGGVLLNFKAYLTGSLYVPDAGPGSVFSTNDDAMTAGAQYALNQSLMNSGNEYCGMTFKGGGGYSYTTAVEGSATLCEPTNAWPSIPAGDAATGGYHSHADDDPDANPERFSGQAGDTDPGDVAWSGGIHLPLSVATIGGRLIIYNPWIGCQRFLQGIPAGTGTTIPVCKY
jgi:hypothetical protein